MTTETRAAAGIEIANLSLYDPITGEEFPCFVVYQDDRFICETTDANTAEAVANDLYSDLMADEAIGALTVEA